MQRVRRNDQVETFRTKTLTIQIFFEIERGIADKAELIETALGPAGKSFGYVGEKVRRPRRRKHRQEPRRDSTSTRTDLEYPQWTVGRPVRTQLRQGGDGYLIVSSTTGRRV